MKSTLTITRKGQTTIPVELRRKLGIGPEGGSLVIDFNEQRSEITIKKPESLEELSERLTKLIKPGTPPVNSVSEWIAKNREADQNGYVD